MGKHETRESRGSIARWHWVILITGHAVAEIAISGGAIVLFEKLHAVYAPMLGIGA